MYTCILNDRTFCLPFLPHKGARFILAGELVTIENDPVFDVDQRYYRIIDGSREQRPATKRAKADKSRDPG